MFPTGKSKNAIYCQIRPRSSSDAQLPCARFERMSTRIFRDRALVGFFDVLRRNFQIYVGSPVGYAERSKPRGARRAARRPNFLHERQALPWPAQSALHRPRYPTTLVRMDKIGRIFVAASSLALVLVAVPAAARAEVGWRPSFAVAQAEAKQAHKLLFVEFTVPG